MAVLQLILYIRIKGGATMGLHQFTGGRLGRQEKAKQGKSPKLDEK